MSQLDLPTLGLDRTRHKPQELVETYQHVRELSRAINNAIVKTIPRETLERGAAALGLVRKGRIELPGSSFADTLLDYCIYFVRTNGQTPLECFVRDSLSTMSAEEQRCLEAKLVSIYSLYTVSAVQRGVGVTLYDLFSGESLFVTDIGMSQTADVGIIFASRIIQLDGINLTGGAAIPLGHLNDEDRDTFVRGMSKALQFGERGIVDPGPLLREALKRIEPVHSDSPELMACVSKFQLKSPGFIPRPRPPRNAPCPCGSGRKYKNCCADRDE